LDSDTEEQVVKDFETSFNLMYDFADMFTICLSYSDNEGNPRFQNSVSMTKIADPILDLRLSYDKYKPILVKVNSDIAYDELDAILDYCMLSGIDGIIADGSTLVRDGLQSSNRKIKNLGAGELSGAPVYERSVTLVQHIVEHTKGRLPVIGCGGIMTPGQAVGMLDAGASLIQLYTGIVYQGPSLVRKILKHLDSK